MFIISITQEVSTNNRADMICRFMNELNANDELYSSKKLLFILISIFKIISVGFNLNRVYRMLFIEPASMYVSEVQGTMRVNRISQRAIKTTAYRLITEESKLERLIRNTQNISLDSIQLAMSYVLSDETTAE